MGSLWVDKYRPRDFSKLTYHTEQANKLSKLVDLGDFPHMLFCGPSGAGKRTRIYCLLKKLYGSGAENVRLDSHEFSTPSGKKLQIHVMNSNYHIELTPSDVGIYDRIIVQEIVKEMAKVQQINRTSQKAFKIVVLMEAESLSRDAQHALRRTMEKYASSCKIILCCESSSRIIDPLRSRCVMIRVPSPSEFELKNCILDVCVKEKITISNELVDKIIEKSNGNVRRALLTLEGTVSQHGFDLNNQNLCEPEWETFLRETAKLAISNQTTEGIICIRQRFYELLSRCISPQVIFVKFTEELIKICDPTLIMSLISAAAKYEYKSKLGSKPIYYLEALVATFMDISTSFKALSV